MIHIIMVLIIWQPLVKRKPKWHMQCYKHFTNQNKLECLLSNQPIECVSKQNQKLRELSNCKINAYSVANTPQTISFKYNLIILFETNYFMIF